MVSWCFFHFLHAVCRRFADSPIVFVYGAKNIFALNKTMCAHGLIIDKWTERPYEDFFFGGKPIGLFLGR